MDDFPAALGTEVQPALISQASMTWCGDREGAGSSSCHQDLNPRRPVGGYHVGLGSGSHRNLMRTQEAPKLALSGKNSQSAPRWLARSLEGLEEESLAEFPETTSSSSSGCVCDQESRFHLWGAPASQAARGHRPLSVPASDYPSLPLSQLRSQIYILWRDSFCGNLSRNPDFDSKEVWEVFFSLPASTIQKVSMEVEQAHPQCPYYSIQLSRTQENQRIHLKALTLKQSC